MTCVCGHLIAVHDIRRNGTRGACSHQDAAGHCLCRVARAMVSGAIPLGLPEVGDE